MIESGAVPPAPRPVGFVSGRALTLAELAQQTVAVSAATPVSDVDRMFRLDRTLRAIIVEFADHVALLSRDHLQTELTGPMGYGRALHTRTVIADLLSGDTPALPGHLSPGEAARRILARAQDGRQEDVLVRTESEFLVASASQIFEQAALEFRHVALHDPLTGLPNRRLLDEHAEALLATGAVSPRIAILYVDLDGFKPVNDTFGHRAGDQVLIDFAQRLRQCVRPDDIVARLGGDEFAVLLLDVSEAQALVVADRVVSAASTPFGHDDQQLHLSATVGLTMAVDTATDDGLSPLDVLLRHADGAMLKAKREGKRRVGRLSAHDEADPLARYNLIRRRLQEAIDRAAFTLAYQPKLDLATGATSSVEALIRWTDREMGAVWPAEFIPIAETSDQIHRIGSWVIDTAATQAGAWLRAGTPRTIAVNVSPQQLSSGTLARQLRSVLRRHCLSPELLRVEITEGSAMADPAHAIDQLYELRAMGIAVDLDDFGVGFSSLAMLHELPLASIKIDKAFVDRIDTARATRHLIRGVIEAAHELGITVTAEGVERVAQLDRLRELHCDSVQGYLIGRPVPADDLGQLGRSPLLEPDRPPRFG